MNCCCENCGWSEIVGSPIICNYNGHRTWRDECCKAWKPKKKETNMVEVVRCKDCKFFEKKDYWVDVGQGVKMLAGGNVPTCTKWGGGDCSTREDGYCYLAERE